MELTPPVVKAFRAYLDGNLRGKHGQVRYDPRAHFGVTPDEIRSRFDFTSTASTSSRKSDER